MTVNKGGAAHELAAGLRALRDRSGLTVRALGEQVSASPANISNWERGDRLPSEERLIKLLDALPATTDEQERLLGLRRQAEGPGQLVAGVPSIGEQLTNLISYEQQARRIIAVAPLIIPGLLQTSAYARATLGQHEDIDTRVALRMGRQEILKRPRNPAELVAVLDTEALIRPIIPPQAMADQLRHLLTTAKLPNVTIQLMSSTASGYNAMHAGPFILLEFATATPVVHLEHYRSSAFLWEDNDVRGYVAAAAEVQKRAMASARSAEAIQDLLNGMEQTS